MTMADSPFDTLGRLADKILTSVPDVGITRRMGVVTAVNASTVDITLGGSTVTIPGVSCLGSYIPTVGDTVWVDINGADLLVVGNIGSIACFRAYASTNTVTGTAAFVQMALVSETFDRGGHFAASAFTAAAHGFYHFSGKVEISMGAGERLFAALFVNGSEASRGVDITTSAAIDHGAVVNDVLELALNDVVTLRVFTTLARNTVQGSALTYLSGYKL